MNIILKRRLYKQIKIFAGKKEFAKTYFKDLLKYVDNNADLIKCIEYYKKINNEFK